MSLNAGLTTIHEDDIAKHQAAAQSLVTKLVILESDDGKSGTALAGTGRRFVSTVSTAGARRTRVSRASISRPTAGWSSASRLWPRAKAACLRRSRSPGFWRRARMSSQFPAPATSSGWMRIWARSM